MSRFDKKIRAQRKSVRVFLRVYSVGLPRSLRSLAMTGKEKLARNDGQGGATCHCEEGFARRGNLLHEKIQ